MIKRTATILILWAGLMSGISPIFATGTWASWNRVTVGTATGNNSQLNGLTIGTATGNYNSWNTLVAPSGAPPAWAIVNSQGIASDVTTNPAVTPAFTNALTNGSEIVVYVYRRSSGTIPAPTDTATNIYADCGAGQVQTDASDSFAIFCVKNSHTTASNVVSVVNSPSQHMDVWAIEVTGQNASTPVRSTQAQVASTGVGGGQNMTSGTATASDTDLRIGGGMVTISSTLTTGTSYTTINNNGFGAFEYSQVNGVTAATWNCSRNSTAYGAAIVVLKH